MSKAKRTVEDLTPEDYASMLNEAVELETVPNDIRVWDRYLFSKCNTPDQAWSLVRIYAMLKEEGVDYETAAKWCDQYIFVQNASKKLRELPAVVESSLWEGLSTIERNQSVFSKPKAKSTEKNIRRSDISATANSEIQEKWPEQAMKCARSRETDLDRLDRQKAHFALGMIVFQTKPWPQFLWSDRSLDIWYDMGFAVVFYPDGPGYLQRMYESFFGKDFGIPTHSFERFYDYWTEGTFAQVFEKLVATNMTYRNFKVWVKMREFQNVKYFLEARSNKREESVWRLRHLLAKPQPTKEFLGPGKELLKCWKDYGLCPGDWADERSRKNKYTIDAYTEKRKKLYQDVLNARKDPMALHQAMKHGSIRAYVKETLSLPAEDVVFLP